MLAASPSVIGLCQVFFEWMFFSSGDLRCQLALNGTSLSITNQIPNAGDNNHLAIVAPFNTHNKTHAILLLLLVLLVVVVLLIQLLLLILLQNTVNSSNRILVN